MTETADRVERAASVGQPLRRKEDARLVTGRTRWTENMTMPGTLHMAVLRSPMAHARISRIDTAVEPDEVLVEVRLPKLGDGWGHRYEKLHRVAQSWAVVRASAVEEALAGASLDAVGPAAEHAAEGTSPPSDLNGRADYREHLARVLTRRAVTAAAGG